ncbi:hypothetical protein HK100_004924 [Physocladia obscura]|uniref:AB hydrolase-1 domain-containing protein n=1 Tax=Physocladia obscura TaxID=109957 RepID=A0AAD5XIZ2_9FUNG|nr:hypothetical protein HK100_004924 [Physocladia obscura]
MSSPNLPSGYGLVTLDKLIGDMSHLIKTSGTINVRDGFFIRWWKYEHPSKTVTNSVPLICIHGGPALTHNYISPLILLADLGVPVIFYDQCGCGSSSFVDDPEKDAPWLLTIDYYVEELQKLISALDLKEFHIYGSSWGTIVTQEFAVLQPEGLKSIILDGVVGDGQVHAKTLWRDVLSTMPSYTVKRLAALEAEKAFDSPEYLALVDTLTHHFTVRLVPQPDCYLDCFRTDGPDSNRGANLKIYTPMQGPSEFGLSGVLEFYSIISRLPKVLVPALVMRGEFDTMSHEASQIVVDAIPKAWPLVTVPKTAHCKSEGLFLGKNVEVVRQHQSRSNIKTLLKEHGPAAILTYAGVSIASFGLWCSLVHYKILDMSSFDISLALQFLRISAPTTQQEQPSSETQSLILSAALADPSVSLSLMSNNTVSISDKIEQKLKQLSQDIKQAEQDIEQEFERAVQRFEEAEASVRESLDAAVSAIVSTSESSGSATVKGCNHGTMLAVAWCMHNISWPARIGISAALTPYVGKMLRGSKVDAMMKLGMLRC